ncbi:MAG: rod shape-determining protein RodA [Candidatus Omnitrophota bacterium]
MRRDIGMLIWGSLVMIIGIGLAALYSAAFDNIRVSQDVFYDQLIFALIGLVITFILSRTDYRITFDIAYIFYGIVVLMLVAVLVAGRHALGATRWLSIAGISFQPSEIAKLAVILALARYLSSCKPALTFSWHDFWGGVLWQDMLVPFLITAVPMLLIFKQPDLGTALLFIGIFVAVLYASELDVRYVLSFLGLCLLMVPFGWQILKPYQKDRLLVFLNPNIDPLGAGYTIIQSKIAIGSGQVIGKGWLSGTQNQLNFLPERHTDFIFSVIGEEWGVVGTLLVLFCYAVLIFAGLKVAEQVKDRYGTLLAVGIISILTLQVVINIGMVLGLCPVVGLTLPLISYGRSSFLIFMIMMGLLLNLSKRRTIF